MQIGFSQDEIFRYSRHLTIPEIGLAGQRKLKSTSVLIIGAGGLGSPVSLYLAAAGIGHLGLVDDDVVEAANLQRQILYDQSHLGKSKVEVARQKLLDLNPFIQVDAIPERLSASNAQSIAVGYDILVDCTDHFSTRYLLNDLCVLTQRPDVYGAVFRFEGQVSVFDARHGSCYRCVFPEPPPPEFSPACMDAGVMGVVPGVIGSLQAAEVIKIALGVGSPLYSRFMLFDALEETFQILQAPKRADCAICGSRLTLTTLQESAEICPDEEGITLLPGESLSPDALAEKLRQDSPPQLVDVRNPVEQQVSSLKGAISIPVEQLHSHLSELDRQREIVLFCRNGVRSARAVKILQDAGFQHVFNLAGGVNAWVKQFEPDSWQY